MIGYWLQSVASTALQKTLRKHFEGVPPSQIVTAAREFPIISRVDVQRAFDQLFATRPGARLVGVHSQMNHETVTLAHLLGPGPFGIDLGPLQHDELDIGDAAPVRCLKNALWLAHQAGRPFVILMTPSMTHGSAGGVHVEIAVPAGEPGAELSQEWFRELEIRVAAGKTYRGRVISLESHFDYSGRGRRRQGAQASPRDTRRVDPAAEDIGTPGPKRRRFRGVAGRDQEAAVFNKERDPLLRSSRYRQDPHDSLSGLAAAGAYDAARNRRAGGLPRRILPAGSLPPTGDDGRRRRRSHRSRAGAHAESHAGSDAQQAPQ